MNAKFIGLTVGLAAGLIGKLYVNHITDKAADALLKTRRNQPQTVVLADIPEAHPTEPPTGTFTQCKPSHK